MFVLWKGLKTEICTAGSDFKGLAPHPIPFFSLCPLDITFFLISAFGDFLSKPLSFLFNEIIKSRQVPTIWKQGFITLLKKKMESLVVKTLVLLLLLLFSRDFIKDSLQID